MSPDYCELDVPRLAVPRTNRSLVIRQDLIGDDAGVAHWRKIVTDLLVALGLLRCKAAADASRNLTVSDNAG